MSTTLPGLLKPKRSKKQAQVTAKLGIATASNWKKLNLKNKGQCQVKITRKILLEAIFVKSSIEPCTKSPKQSVICSSGLLQE
jgi:hypothetical protein